jgi:2-methylisocitrate lyase-like PEP mutase family enzyme
MTGRLDALLDQHPIVAGGVYDCLSAAVVESAGYPALALSGAGVAAAGAGVPDLGLLSFGELLDAARNIIAATSLPVIVDADTGFGNELNAMRTAEALVAAGASAIVIEDQVAPKRCGHLDGKQVVPTADFLSKLAAVRRVLDGTGTSLVARTDAIAVEGLDRAVQRARAAGDVGADVTFVEAPTSAAQLELIAEQVPGHKMFSLATGGRSPSLPFAELHAMGFDLLIVPGLTLMPALAAMRECAVAVLERGSDAPAATYGVSPRQIFETVGLTDWLEREARVAREGGAGWAAEELRLP